MLVRDSNLQLLLRVVCKALHRLSAFGWTRRESNSRVTTETTPSYYAYLLPPALVILRLCFRMVTESTALVVLRYGNL